MTISTVLSKINIDRAVLHSIHYLTNKVKNVNISQQMNYKFIYRCRSKLARISSPFTVVCLLFCLCLIQFYRSTSDFSNPFVSPSWKQDELEQWIDHVRDIAIVDQNVQFNLSYQVTSNDIPPWISRYKLTRFFDFLWLQNGAYRWHLQQLMNFRDRLVNKTFPPARRIRAEEFSSSENIFQSIKNQPQNGILLDTAADPVGALFAPLPRTSATLKQFCEENLRAKNFPPCSTRAEKLSSSSSFDVLFTFALYNVVIVTNCQSCPTKHFDELVWFLDDEPSRPLRLVEQILPRLIRLLALVPRSARILLPQYQPDSLIDVYLNIFIERGLITTKERFLPFNASIFYHSHVLYGTSTPRSDVALLQHVLHTDKVPLRRELILVLGNRLDSRSYNGIIQTINQFELPADYEFLHLHEYKETKFNVKQLAELFRQSLIIIGKPSDLLSNLVWCLPGTHLIEIASTELKIDTYRLSVQLKLHYWLARATRDGGVDIDDFRNLMLKVLTNIDN